MGKFFFDQFSILHFASGVTAYFWKIISFKWFVLLYILLEIMENSSVGINFVNTYIPFWPRAKQKPESYLNMFSDVLFAVMGWQLTEQLDKYYRTNYPQDYIMKNLSN